MGSWKDISAAVSGRTSVNLEHNKRLEESLAGGIVHGQAVEPVCSMRFGRNSMKHCGCEIIAAYNIMLLTGRYMPLCEVISEFEMNRLSYLFFTTFFGSDPKKLRRFFDAHGVEYDFFKDVQQFIEKAKNGGYAIVSFWVNSISEHRFNRIGSGLHTVACSIDAQTGETAVFNRYNGDSEPRIYQSIDELLYDRKYIAGYYFAKQEL